MTYTADLGTAIVLSCKQSFPIVFFYFSFPPAPAVHIRPLRPFLKEAIHATLSFGNAQQ